jgi:type II secretory pathway pseudopilin PulG
MTTKPINNNDRVAITARRNGGTSIVELPRARRLHSRTTRRAFTMAEMMVAAVILAGGLIMVATLYPVAWSRARTVAEASKATAAINAADTAVNKLVQLRGGGAGLLLGEFSGIDIIDNLTGLAPPDGIDDFADGNVHVLNMENALFLSSWSTIPEWALPTTATALDPAWPNNGAAFLNIPAQIAFHERVFPPLSPRPIGGSFEGDLLQEQWDSVLADRRFAWSVLYQFDPAPTSGFEERTLNIYYATVRLGEQGSRYPRQHIDSATAADTYPNPRAINSDQDVRLPVPWLVDIEVTVNADAMGLPLPKSGIPSQANIGAAANAFAPINFGNNTFLVDLFTPGNQVIDYRSGQIYRIIDSSVLTDDAGATLTLDRELQVSDVDDSGNNVFEIGVEDIRRVWVFPPAAEASGQFFSGTGGGRIPAPSGKSPLADLDVRRIRLAPN